MYLLIWPIKGVTLQAPTEITVKIRLWQKHLKEKQLDSEDGKPRQFWLDASDKSFATSPSAKGLIMACLIGAHTHAHTHTCARTHTHTHFPKVPIKVVVMAELAVWCSASITLIMSVRGRESAQEDRHYSRTHTHAHSRIFVRTSTDTSHFPASSPNSNLNLDPILTWPLKPSLNPRTTTKHHHYCRKMNI